MKDARLTKMAIEELKHEFSNLSYCIHNIVTLPKDKESANNLMSAKMAAVNIDRIIKKEISDIEKKIEADLNQEQRSRFKSRLATINSPDRKMQKNAEMFLESLETPNLLIKNAVSEQLKKVSKQNGKTKEGSVGDRLG